MKKTLTVTMLFLAFLSFGQTIPTKEKATKDFQLEKESIEKQLKFFGIESGLKDIKVEHSAGPYRKYSIGAKNYYYDHVSEQDAAYHKFTLTTPTYENGDKFELDVIIDYDSYEYLSSGYRNNLGKYALRYASVSVKSYEGKDLTTAKLIEKLNELSSRQGQEFEVANKYHFISIEEVSFKKLEQRNNQGTALNEYEIKIIGKGADFGTNGDNFIEYEIEETADIEAYFTAEIALLDGKWDFYSLYQDRSKGKISNVIENPNVPAYISLRYRPLKELMAGYQVADEISIYSNKYMNDLKSLVMHRFFAVEKDEYIKGELLTGLFSTEAGKSALDQLYNIKKTMKDFYLDSVEFQNGQSPYTRIEEGGFGQYKIVYVVGRNASKELLKKAKKNGATKAQLAIIKYPAKGYYDVSMELSVVDGKVVISEVGDPGPSNQIRYGNRNRHPISTLD